jgi:hypothetical protein
MELSYKDVVKDLKQLKKQGKLIFNQEFLVEIGRSVHKYLQSLVQKVKIPELDVNLVTDLAFNRAINYIMIKNIIVDESKR